MQLIDDTLESFSSIAALPLAVRIVESIRLHWPSQWISDGCLAFRKRNGRSVAAAIRSAGIYLIRCRRLLSSPQHNEK